LNSGLLKLLEPVVTECDLRAKMVLESQSQLIRQIELFSAGDLNLMTLSLDIFDPFVLNLL
jgi:hypothetical protein